MFAKLFKFLAAASIVASVTASPLPAAETTDLGTRFAFLKYGKSLINLCSCSWIYFIQQLPRRQVDVQLRQLLRLGQLLWLVLEDHRDRAKGGGCLPQRDDHDHPTASPRSSGDG